MNQSVSSIQKLSREKLFKSEPQSDPETSDREVKPKFVVGRKKYGRRSRPLTDIKSEKEDTATLTESDDEDEEDDQSFYDTNASSSESKTNNKVKRSVSQSEMQESKRRRPISAGRLKRCASLPPQSRNVHGRNSKIGKNRTGMNFKFYQRC